MYIIYTYFTRLTRIKHHLAVSKMCFKPAKLLTEKTKNYMTMVLLRLNNPCLTLGGVVFIIIPDATFYSILLPDREHADCFNTQRVWAMIFYFYFPLSVFVRSVC